MGRQQDDLPGTGPPSESEGVLDRRRMGTGEEHGPGTVEGPGTLKRS
ncbi:hypothetical protein [Streptomyces virginiae]